MTATVNRRTFLSAAAAAGAGLLVRFRLDAAETASPLKLNAFVHISPDDSVLLYIHKAEMGQGTVTSLSMLLAEELECDWKKIRTDFPGVNREYGPNQGVVGSASIRTSWESLRRAGATAREMLKAAAAQKWSADLATLRAENSWIVNPANNDRASFGSLAEAASKLPPPSNTTLKEPARFHTIGHATKRLDTPSKVDGSAVFGIDVRLPNMQYAVVARCPVFGGKVARFDASKAKAAPGVKNVFQIPSGVAVVADSTWAAMEGRRRLEIDWNEGPVAAVSTASLTQTFASLMAQPGQNARKTGDAEAALASAAHKIEAIYQVPFLAHAPMEPLNATADVRPDRCEVWASTQGQTAAFNEARRITGLPPEAIKVYTKYMGGGFGRRARSDYIGEAVEVSKAAGVPVKLTWSREDDLQQDWYRPASYAHFSGGLDADGWPVAWTTRVACPPFGGGGTATEGIANMPYGLPHLLVDYHPVDQGIPVSYWRSVGYSQNVFFTESFLDELALAGKKDPVEVRLHLLANVPRLKAALELAADKAGWGKPLPPGHGRGVALSNNIGSNTVQIAEVSVERGQIRVHRVVCAVDCGHAVNPWGVQQQIQSGIVFGLTAALKGGITLDKGRVQQSNFHQYDMLRIDEMPKVEVHIVPSQSAPGGIGEASTPGIAPAMCNALFAATGKRVRKLPVKLDDLG
ncbi:MAG TPA: xanthine dehydrogenase family protein molybdopterin-binding subunit [Verrucomicrobiae bacterium]|nr:xanthine dehydrogenase family protein molybdopterin-binding subunit [Verrucomicrobiae bacterium]